jgi:arachidonate 15-lipoxygenase
MEVKMSVLYNREFAPYVIPAGVPTDLDMVPDLAWFARMGRAQAQAAVGEVVMKWADRLPRGVRTGRIGQWLAAAQHAVVQPAAGRLPNDGDAGFAYRRFAGMNPMTIQRVRTPDALPLKLRLDDALLSRLLGAPQTFAERLAHGDLYLLDLRVLQVAGGTEMQAGKFVAPAAALFCYAPEVDAPFPVVPLAIECAVGDADGETVLVTPLDGERWKSARHLVNVADVNFTELCLHLARAHLMTAPFAISLHRNLPKQHPIYQFLLPHMRFELFVSRMAWLQGMRNAKGILVRSLAGSARWSQQVARRLWEQHAFADQHFLRDMAARGMDAAPFDYPYRDDGKLLWEAIATFAEGYVVLTYPDDAALQADTALLAFLREVQSPDGGNMREVLAGDAAPSRQELAEILTQVLFVAGPMHALLHYASAAELQDMERNPGFLTANPLTHGAAALPGRRAMHQFTRVMGTNARHDTLGDFSGYALGQRADCQPLIQQFQRELTRIEQTIALRNQNRLAPFVHLLPSRICNGITV